MSFCDPLATIQKLSLEKGMQVADFGAGVGYHSLILAEQVGESGRVYAIDVQKEFLDTLQGEAERKGFQNVEILRRDLEQANGTCLSDELLDVVLISNTLFQIEQKETVLKEAYRILQKGGKLLIVDFAWEVKEVNVLTSKEDIKEVSKKARDLAEKVGFTLVREIDAGDCHYGLLFKKK